MYTYYVLLVCGPDDALADWALVSYGFMSACRTQSPGDDFWRMLAPLVSNRRDSFRGACY